VASSESELIQSIRLRFSRGLVRLFRNNVGVAWQGESVRQLNGDMLIRKPRRVVYGLMTGSADLIGWRTVTITPDMVGIQLAQFIAMETKSAHGRASEGQHDFNRTVREAGGAAGFVRSIEDADKLLTLL
jgi:hypothetical protein